MQRKKIIVLTFVAVLMLCGGLMAAEKKPVLRVNDTILYEPDLHEVVERLVPSAMFHGGLNERRIEKYRDQAIEIMIEEELLYQVALKKIKVKRRELNKAEDEMIKKYDTRERYEKALEQAGITRKEFRKKLEKKLLNEKLLEQEVEQKATVSDREIKEYYLQSKENFRMPESRRLREIQINVDPSASAEVWADKERHAKEVLAKARSGEDFGQLAWDYSTDKYRVKGGELGVVHEGRLVKEVQDAAWKLGPNEISDVVRTIYGYHIIKVEEIISSSQLELDEVKEKIHDKLLKQKKEALKAQLLSTAKEQAKIEIY